MKMKQTSNSRLGFCCRSLGVHCSKVRSLTLDSWEPELLKVLFVLVVTFNSTQVLHLYIVKNFWEMHLKQQKVSLAYKMVKTFSQMYPVISILKAHLITCIYLLTIDRPKLPVLSSILMPEHSRQTTGVHLFLARGILLLKYPSSPCHLNFVQTNYRRSNQFQMLKTGYKSKW